MNDKLMPPNSGFDLVWKSKKNYPERHGQIYRFRSPIISGPVGHFRRIVEFEDGFVTEITSVGNLRKRKPAELVVDFGAIKPPDWFQPE